jgi:hypothetical protein
MFFRWDQSIYNGFFRVLFWGVIEPECWVFKSIKSLGYGPKHAQMLQKSCSGGNPRNPSNCWDPKHP